VVDVTAGVQFIENGRLYVRLDNIFDERYLLSVRPFGARPGRPFQFLAGIKYSLGGN